MEGVKDQVVSCLHRDPVASDLRVSLFVAACQSYKRDSVLRPFPPAYVTQHNKDFDELLTDTSGLPGVRDLVRLRAGESDHHLSLVHWVLSSRSFAVKTLHKEQYAKLCSLTDNGGGVSAPVPDFLFEVEHSETLNAHFTKTRGERDVFYAFHGSRLENWHSILHHGLHCHLNKTSLFGEGTYLTSDLSMAVLYSPHGKGWTESLLGSQLSCVAMCEVIHHPEVKCQVKRKDCEAVDRSRSRARNSEGGEVPHKYFIVTNNQLLRVRYLLVYSQRTPRVSVRTSWVVRHHFSIMMGLYILLLICIGAFNSASFWSFWNRLF